MVRPPTPLRPGHQVELLAGGSQFFAALITAMDTSQRELRLETYIFHLDVSGERVAAALERAARRGVAVYLVMDGVGTPSLSPQWAARFDAAGVQWRIFLPLGYLGLLIPSRWRRLHRKLCVIDGEVAFCGGINVLDDFFDINHGVLATPRLDFSVRVRGPLVRSAHAVMTQFWWRLQAARTANQVDVAGLWAALQQVLAQARRTHAAQRHASAPESTMGQSMRAELLLRDNLRHRTLIERSYRRAIAAARHEVILANAYFLPGAKLRRALMHAARRGVQVRLLLQGRYEYFMQYHASRPVYGALLAAGVEIHEYATSFLHAKVAVIDGHWATIGSSNLDPLSLLLAREANVVVDDAAFAQELRQHLLAAMAQGGVRLEAGALAARPWHQRILDRLAFGLMRVVLFLNAKRY